MGFTFVGEVHSDRAASVNSLIGRDVSQNIIDRINRETGGSNYFGSSDDQFRDIHWNFIDKVVEPTRQASFQLEKAFNDLAFNEEAESKVDLFFSRDDFKIINNRSKKYMMCHFGLRNLFRENCVDGFGFSEKDLMDEKEFNEYLESTVSVSSDDDYHSYVKGIVQTNDEDLNLSTVELLNVRETFNTIDSILEDTFLDPTNINYNRG